LYRQITDEILLKTNCNTLLHNGPISSTTQALTTAVVQSCTVVSSKQHSSCTSLISLSVAQQIEADYNHAVMLTMTHSTAWKPQRLQHSQKNKNYIAQRIHFWQINPFISLLFNQKGSMVTTDSMCYTYCT